MNNFKVGDRVRKINLDTFSKGQPVATIDRLVTGSWGTIAYFKETGTHTWASSLRRVPTPRPHAELIKQWAEDDTVEIEFYSTRCNGWEVTSEPGWYLHVGYRIKPPAPVKSPQEIEKDKLVAELEVIRKRLDELDVGG